MIVADGEYSGTENTQFAADKIRKQSNQCTVSFLHEQGTNCPYQNPCKPKMFKRIAKIVISKAEHERAKIQQNMNSKGFTDYARFRNGVKTIPSNIRRDYHLEKIPRGKNYFLTCRQSGSSNPFFSRSSLSFNISSVFPSAMISPCAIRMVRLQVSRIISRSCDAIIFK